MIEKLYKKVKNIQDFNETASKLRQMGLKDELKNLAGKYKVPEVDLKEFLSGKRYFLIDGKIICQPGVSCWMKCLI